MKTAFDVGSNRTGIATAPVEAPKTIQGAEEGGASSAGNGELSAAMRLREANEAERIGGVPPPGTLKGAVKTAVTALKGEKATVLVDKLGERAAFERAGTRLYELAMLKAQAYPSWDGGPSLADLREIRDEELAHFGLVIGCIEELGGDPTAMTPSADIAINLSMGIFAVLADPRTDLRQCVEGLLVAELSDNACWETLIALARELGQDKMAQRMEIALAAERDHLRRVKAWAASAVAAASQGEQPVRQEPAAHP